MTPCTIKKGQSLEGQRDSQNDQCWERHLRTPDPSVSPAPAPCSPLNHVLTCCIHKLLDPSRDGGSSMSWGLAQRACFTAVLCWAISAKPNLSVGVPLAGSLQRKKREPVTPVHLKTSSCICQLCVLNSSSVKKKGEKSIRIYSKKYSGMIFRVCFFKLTPQRCLKKLHTFCLMLWALTEPQNTTLSLCQKDTECVEL